MSAENSADTVAAVAGRNEARQALTETNPLRAVVGALLLPAVSAVTGNMMLHRFVPNNFLRTVLGGCLFIVLRDAANLLFSYQAVRRRRTRRILPYQGHVVPRLL